MKKFSIQIRRNSTIWHNHYLSDKFIKEEGCYGYFKRWYPLEYFSRGFDKPAIKWRDGACFWWLDDKRHREDKPAIILSDGRVSYYENGKKIK